MFEDTESDTVIQMRIEKDWRLFSAITLGPTVGKEEDYLPHFREIMGKVRNTFDGRVSVAYIVCDEAALIDDLDEIRSVARSEFGIDLFWKSDILGQSFLASQNTLNLSLIDFEMALQAQYFVGLTRSTFSNMATFQRYANTRENVRSHYIYNGVGPFLKLRIDNGAYASAEAAASGCP